MTRQGKRHRFSGERKPKMDIPAQMGGMMAVIGSLIGHIAYGAALGGIAGGPAGESRQPLGLLGRIFNLRVKPRRF